MLLLLRNRRRHRNPRRRLRNLTHFRLNPLVQPSSASNNKELTKENKALVFCNTLNSTAVRIENTNNMDQNVNKYLLHEVLPKL